MFAFHRTLNIIFGDVEVFELHHWEVMNGSFDSGGNNKCLGDLCIGCVGSFPKGVGYFVLNFLLLESHLSTCVNLCFARVISLFLCSLFMYVCTFLISPLCVAIGGCISSRVWCGQCQCEWWGFLCLWWPHYLRGRFQ